MIACSKMGLHFTACTNKKYFPDESLVEQCKAFARESGGSVTLTEDVKAGTTGADVIYTDVWVSMGRAGCSMGGAYPRFAFHIR